jgi:hypothetical protein
MKHAKIDELYEINTLIESIRKIKNVTEKTPGHFYYKNRNVIHFHVNSKIIYADIGDTRIIVENNKRSFDRIIANIKLYIEEIDIQQKEKSR